MSREAIQQAIIGKVADLLSGPGGLASFLRTRQLGARLAGPSLPLDIGYAQTIPPGIRNAVILRDRRCRWPGGYHQPAAACQAPRQAQSPRRPHQPQRLRPSLFISPSGRDPPVGLDAGPEQRRHHHRLEPRPHQGAAQPQSTGPRRVNPRTVGSRPLGGPIGGGGVGGARRGERLAHAESRRARARRAGPARSFGGRDHRAARPDPMRVRGHSRSSPDRIRTGVTALRGRRPRPLDDGAEHFPDMAGITGSAQTTASATVRPTGGSPLLRRTSADARYIRAVS